MRIPVELLHKVVWFVFDHYHSKGFHAVPAAVGNSCGKLAEEWLDGSGGAGELSGYTRVAIVSYCERLGKHLSLFFISEKEG